MPNRINVVYCELTYIQTIENFNQRQKKQNSFTEEQDSSALED